MYKLLKKILLLIICLSVIVCISFSILQHLFPLSYYDTLNKYCTKYNIDTNLVLALAKAESNFKEDAVSHAGAKGIMQLTDNTFTFCKENAGIESSDIFDPDANINAGVWYLSYLMKKYDGNIKNSLAAYNAGIGNVDKWLEDDRYSINGESLTTIPFKETKRYTDKISRYKKIYSILY